MKQNFKKLLLILFNNKYFQYIVSFILSCSLMYAAYWLFTNPEIFMWIVLILIGSLLCIKATIDIHKIIFKE